MDRPTPMMSHMSHDTSVTLITHHTFGLRDRVTRDRCARWPTSEAHAPSGAGFEGGGAAGVDTRTDSWEPPR